jgi:hypothetical protein
VIHAKKEGHFITRSLTRTLLRLVAIGVVVLSFVFAAHTRAASAAAETPPNTTITNTASATYTDANNVSYTTNSNTVTTTVQNAPSLSLAGTAPQNVSPGEVVTDNYTVTNTGNATGAITLNTPSITAGGTLDDAWILNGAATGACSVATPCPLATLNTQAALTSATVGTAITIGLQYTVATTTTPGTVISTTLTGTITQPAINASVPAETSPTATASDTDTVKADARLDLFKSAAAPTSPTGLITYTIDGNDGGGFGADAVLSAGRVLGLTTPGVIAVLDKLPVAAGTGITQPALFAAPAVPALPANDTGTVYYSTSTDGLSAWSTVFNTNATYIALFVTTSNASGIVFPSAPAGSSGGGVAQTSSQFVFTFQTTQPAGNGVSDPGALKNIANSIIGGNPGAGGTPIIAPGVAVDTDYETTSTPSYPASTFGPTASNTTPSSGTTPPGGASNLVSTAAFAQQSALNGPLDNAAATGSYNGVVGVSNQNDFTAVGFVCSNGPATTVVGATPAVACNWPTTTPVAIPNTVANNGNGADTYNIYANAPAGYTVQMFAVSACPTTTPTVLPIAPYATGCTIGAAISGVSASGGSVTTTAATTIAAGNTFNYVAEYAPAAGTTPLPFVPVAFDTIAYGSAATVTAGVPTVGTDANETYNVIYPGGPLQVTKSQTIVTNCSGTPAPTLATAVCPGGTITYSLTYRNVAPAALATGGSGLGTEPAFALNGIVASGATVLDDGTLGTTNWGTTTFGIDAVVAPVLNGGTATYSPTSTLSTGTYPAKTQGPTKISVALPGTIQPGISGTISFQVTVI